MIRSTSRLAALLLFAGLAAACSDTADLAGPAPTNPNRHIGTVASVAAPAPGSSISGFECHVGTQAAVFPPEERYGVHAEESHATTSESGSITMTCKGTIPADRPAPKGAKVYRDLPCVVPGPRIGTRSHLVFTPSRHIILTCHWDPAKA